MDARTKAFCEEAAEYAGFVAVYLADQYKLEEGKASSRVVQHLAIVLEELIDNQSPPQDVAWSLIPQPHDFPMPTQSLSWSAHREQAR